MSQPISHFTHPKHRLVKTAGRDGHFTCDMCEAAGSGDRYRCDACNFDLHEHCAACPATLLSFFAHPLHPLTLVPPLADPRGPMLLCDLCDHPILGYSYRCSACCFDLHPLCSLLPHTVRSDLHRPPAPTHAAPGRLGPVRRLQGELPHLALPFQPVHVELHTYCLHGAAPASSASTSDDGGGKKGCQGMRLVKFLGHTALHIAEQIIADAAEQVIANAISNSN